jgi:polyisoprenoid-binding protein YceI
MSFARSAAWLLLLIGNASMASATGPAETSLVIDGRHSSARFLVHLRVRMRAEGALTGVSGTLKGSAGKGWRVAVKVDGRSLRFAGPRWMDRITRSDSFLAVDRFPVIRFESGQFSDDVLRKGGPLRGELTLRGLTQPVSFQLLPSQCAHAGRDCDIHVQGTISRHAFGMNAHRAMVKDEVDFHMQVRLKPGAAGG